MNWPDTADGDVFRSLETKGFDFAKPAKIDFEIDFDIWPPPDEAIAGILSEYPDAKVFPPEDGHAGYVHVQQDAVLTYEFVVMRQVEITELVKAFGGVCEAWGVLHPQ